MVDVNRDGALDIYLANANRNPNDLHSDKLLINDGAGHFQDETSSRILQTWLGTEGVAAGDIDGDGDADLLAVPLFGGVRVLINNGRGFFSDSTAQRLDASAYGSIDVTVHDVNHDGRLVRTLLDRAQPAGEYTIGWDGRNEFGTPAPAGAYFYRLIAGGKTVATRKMMLLSQIEP